MSKEFAQANSSWAVDESNLLISSSPAFRRPSAPGACMRFVLWDWLGISCEQRCPALCLSHSDPAREVVRDVQDTTAI